MEGRVEDVFRKCLALRGWLQAHPGAEFVRVLQGTCVWPPLGISSVNRTGGVNPKFPKWQVRTFGRRMLHRGELMHAGTWTSHLSDTVKSKIEDQPRLIVV